MQTGVCPYGDVSFLRLRACCLSRIHYLNSYVVFRTVNVPIGSIYIKDCHFAHGAHDMRTPDPQKQAFLQQREFQLANGSMNTRK